MGHIGLATRLEDEYVGKRVMGWRCRRKEGEEDRSVGGWTTSGTTCQRERIVRGGRARPG